MHEIFIVLAKIDPWICKTRLYSSDEIWCHINKLVCMVLKEYLQINDPNDWQQFTVPAKELGSFLADPHSYELKLISDMKLDTSAKTAHNMQCSPGNQTVILLLATRASEYASEKSEYYGNNSQEVDWRGLFNNWVYRLLLEVMKAKAGVWDNHYEAQKQESKKRRIASVMAGIACCMGDNKEYNNWSDILYSLDHLGIASTSDTEEVFNTQGQQGIIKYEPDFHNSQFNILFDTVDRIPQVAMHLFDQVRQRQLPRIRGIETVEYLEKMKNNPTNVTMAEVIELRGSKQNAREYESGRT
ncbi:hypothetical protein F5876DRAFT_67093 [Lentinula aff. lateritia]|uniref:Uncharacterized protein n=1 Tax=Lentinula aff. lateritia TaxID=2804960 RepID=A0ACC1TVP8_9AGAR|nr:hypothetical protein F5876DRAFT_67093 [Lentinula aff. lateritia]